MKEVRGTICNISHRGAARAYDRYGSYYKITSTTRGVDWKALKQGQVLICQVEFLPTHNSVIEASLLSGYYINEYGVHEWYRDGYQHRDVGPAVVYPDGDQFWYQHGEIHREDGPAIIYGYSKMEWYLHDEQIIDPEIIKLMTGKEEDRLLLKLKYGI